MSATSDLDAEWIYGDHRKRSATPRRSDEEARRKGETLVKDAELKALEIITSAERARSHVEAELAREQARLAEQSKRLARVLANALEEIERTSANGFDASARDLRELKALRDELGGTE